MEIGELADRACGIAADGKTIAESTVAEARGILLERLGEEPCAALIARHSADVLRDEGGHAHGCSFPECPNAAVWERVFARSISATTMLSAAVMIASLSDASPVRVLIRPGLTDFENMRMVIAELDGHTVAHQYGCWEHIGGFLAYPGKVGSFNFDCVDARLPETQPHDFWQVKSDIWEFMKTAERAQKMGFPEGTRELCQACGLPYEHATGFGTRPGEGDDFWRIFCDYCGAEIEIEIEGV
jgi:hypothetical protein